MAKEYREEAQFPLVPAVVKGALIARRVQILLRLGGRTGLKWAGAALVCCESLEAFIISGERRGVG